MKPRFRCHPCTFRHVDSHRLPDPHLTHQVRLFSRRSPQRSSANAAVGGLKPPPAGRLRRAYLHLPRSTASRSSTYRKPPSAFVTHHYAYLRVVECPSPDLLRPVDGLPVLLGRALLRVGWAAQRGPVSHVDAGLFCAASLRTRRARFPGTGLSSDLCRARDRVCVDPVISCRARGERQVPLRLLHCASLMVPSSFIACAPSPCGPSLAVSRLDGRYPAD